ncbi:hypothetical protein NCAS_0J01440 [Naumovozyma castellii]|uniref:Uncharacterized protein n=1 Tax=Naumovozyma castellii TaxID=27288 RepID=G0VKT5_NAUCA|nr:hypothetical protein NCAS_0J01440 [Naumovozyma castellii CBS 4309]CCC72123.1 hypothetical protein NCAS_0J01440 [Naumovozyma castellii CBS 4309]
MKFTTKKVILTTITVCFLQLVSGFPIEKRDRNSSKFSDTLIADMFLFIQLLGGCALGGGVGSIAGAFVCAFTFLAILCNMMVTILTLVDRFVNDPSGSSVTMNFSTMLDSTGVGNIDKLKNYLGEYLDISMHVSSTYMGEMNSTKVNCVSFELTDSKLFPKCVDTKICISEAGRKKVLHQSGPLPLKIVKTLATKAGSFGIATPIKHPKMFMKSLLMTFKEDTSVFLEQFQELFHKLKSPDWRGENHQGHEFSIEDSRDGNKLLFYFEFT